MFSVQCSLCKNKNKNRVGCSAFPDRIPWVVLNGLRDHREPYKGDKGIRFEPKKKMKRG